MVVPWPPPNHTTLFFLFLAKLLIRPPACRCDGPRTAFRDYRSDSSPTAARRRTPCLAPSLGRPEFWDGSAVPAEVRTHSSPPRCAQNHLRPPTFEASLELTHRSCLRLGRGSWQLSTKWIRRLRPVALASTPARSACRTPLPGGPLKPRMRLLT